MSLVTAAPELPEESAAPQPVAVATNDRPDDVRSEETYNSDLNYLDKLIGDLKWLIEQNIPKRIAAGETFPDNFDEQYLKRKLKGILTISEKYKNDDFNPPERHSSEFYPSEYQAFKNEFNQGYINSINIKSQTIN